jgi:hypothetical protein
VAYRNSRMFGVADVHADTVSTYKLFGADLARAGATVATAASHAAEDAAPRLQVNNKRSGGASGGGADTTNSTGDGGVHPPSAASGPRSPTPSSSTTSNSQSPASRYKSPTTIASPSALDRATLASAEKGAASRGHSTFARLFAERQAAAETAGDGDHGGEFAPAPTSSSTSGGEQPDGVEFSDENSALLNV